VLVAAAVLVGAQIAAVVVYRVIERSRVADPGSFASERLAGSPVAPDLVLERADGSRLRLADLAGRVRLVHFWATWCPPCVEELPGLLATSRELEPRGLTLLAISMDKDWAQIRRFFPDEVPAEVVRAGAADAHRRYDVASLPDTYLVDETGRLTRRYGGARDWRRGAAIEHLRDQVSR
jgi:thiol-disulfide isomerase/thioredoxin